MPVHLIALKDIAFTDYSNTLSVERIYNVPEFDFDGIDPDQWRITIKCDIVSHGQ